MPVPNAARLLEIWESAPGDSPVEVGLMLLAAAGEDASSLTIGEFDARLLELRRSLFGRAMNASASCPDCSSRLDVELDAARLRPPGGAPPAESLEIEQDGYRVSFRMPRIPDARAAAAAGSAGAARLVLLRRCVTAARRDGAGVPAEDLPEAVCRAIGERMDCEDPEAGFVLGVTCPCCGHSWEAPLDAAAYLAREINAWAVRVLSEVHTLASRYGWAERDILALSPKRRRLYLEMGSG